MAGSKTLRRREADVEEFLAKLNQLLAVLEPEQRTFGGDATRVPRAGHENEAAQRALEIDRVSGKAAVAIASVGVVVAWKPAGQPPGYTQPLNPAQVWRTILDEYAILDVSIILACCNQAAGLLDAKATEAEEHEASFTGKVQHVTGFWRRVRGDRERGVPGQYGAVVLGAALTLLTTLVAAYLGFRFGWVGAD